MPKTKKNSVVLTVSGWNNSETHIVLDPDKRFVAVTTVENYLDHFGLENATATFDKQYLGDLIHQLQAIHKLMEE